MERRKNIKKKFLQLCQAMKRIPKIKYKIPVVLTFHASRSKRKKEIPNNQGTAMVNCSIAVNFFNVTTDLHNTLVDIYLHIKPIRYSLRTK